MSSTSDQIKGMANKAAGSAKEGLGSLTGDAKLEAEGQAQQVKGAAQKTVGDAKGAVKKTVNDNL